MDVEWNTRPPIHHPNQDWHDLPPLPHFAASSPPQTAFPASGSLSQRRRSSAAHQRPAAPPPNLPIPSVPPSTALLAAPHPTTVQPLEDGSLPSNHINGRPVYTNTYTRPAPSPSLSAVAAFSQSRQAATVPSSSTGHASSAYHSNDDLSDPPPQSYLQSTTSTSPPSNRRMESGSDNLLHPDPPERPGRRGERSEHRPSSRRALTRALELAREAVQLDSTNDNPEAAVQAYARSVALLSEVMERVRRGEDSTESRRRRRRSVAAQEDEIRRLQNIHDTYADRMNILSIIYSIPAVPYSTPASYSSTSIDSATSTSPTTSNSPSSDGSPLTPHQNPVYTHAYNPSEELPPRPQDFPTQRDQSNPRDTGSVYILDEQVLSGIAVPMNSSASHHPYAATVEPPNMPHQLLHPATRL
ncbi:hypothetical protein D9611_003366 [Ephemerocybe angulata]|uniref:MIT domain-containing protein n=1 Tax=Ephemerocybe angulata TaxID=980116 RepID=A0A8H5FHH2_9AGAR|nr:hypothetical protein D9611_003366 [Tulosesus angulatus]